MPQLELGILPLTLPLKEGLKVAFFIEVRSRFKKRKKETHIGIVRSFSGSYVVIEGITRPGLYNRAPEALFEVHKYLSIEQFSK